ncbi:MAG: rane-bound lytic murein transglycosylase precursor [Sediminibacterium sp.]|nr:rane-bound lytic murein transglycosylase precursor [Sediminibacterium sp.]
MKWFKLTFTLGNAIAASKSSLVYLGLLVLSLTTMSFTDPINKRASDTSVIAASDSTVTNDKAALKSLFTNTSIDESRPQDVQLNPQAVSFVQEYIRTQGEELEKMKTWGKPYLEMYDNVLSSYGIPKEMKYLSVIESHLTPGLVSWAGAVGPWQIMPDEARRFGLRTGGRDERTDFYKSTEAAAKLMKELYGQFGDWLLVVAAYNAGAGGVRKAIRKAGSRDFWSLQYYLPEETRNHVKKFIGTHYIFEGGGGWTTMTAAETEAKKLASLDFTPQVSTEDLGNTDVVEVSGRYNSLVVANGLAMDINQFNRWNPGFDKAVSEGKKYSLRLSKDRTLMFEAKKSSLLMESVKVLLQGNLASN